MEKTIKLKVESETNFFASDGQKPVNSPKGRILIIEGCFYLGLIITVGSKKFTRGSTLMVAASPFNSCGQIDFMT